MTDTRARGGEDGISNRRRNRGRGRLAEPDRRFRTGDKLNVLSECKSFDTLGDHVIQSAARFGIQATEHAHLRSLFEDFLASGFLLSEDALMDTVRAVPRRVPSRIATVGVITAHRPGTLRRSLSSIGEFAARSDRSLDVAVFDGSEDQSARAVTESLARSTLSGVVGLLYAGSSEKHRYAQELMKLGCSKEAVEFGLFDPESVGRPVGANRNAMCTCCAGSCAAGQAHRRAVKHGGGTGDRPPAHTHAGFQRLGPAASELAADRTDWNWQNLASLRAGA